MKYAIVFVPALGERVSAAVHEADGRRWVEPLFGPPIELPANAVLFDDMDAVHEEMVRLAVAEKN